MGPLGPTVIRAPSRPAHRLIAIPTALSRIPATLYNEKRKKKKEKLLEGQERVGFISDYVVADYIHL